MIWEALCFCTVSGLPESRQELSLELRLLLAHGDCTARCANPQAATLVMELTERVRRVAHKGGTRWARTPAIVFVRNGDRQLVGDNDETPLLAIWTWLKRAPAAAAAAEASE